MEFNILLSLLDILIIYDFQADIPPDDPSLNLCFLFNGQYYYDTNGKADLNINYFKEDS